MALGLTQPVTEIGKREILRGGKDDQCVELTTTFVSQLSLNLSASATCNPLVVARPVEGLVCLFRLFYDNNSNLDCVQKVDIS
jgi:hypothetical protein